MVKRIQNRIAESRWALPVCSVYTLLICLASGLFEEGIWLQLALTAVATLLMVELNNSNSLIRIYSRMVSCSFLALTMMMPHRIESVDGSIVTLCFVTFYLFLCRAYQNNRATGHVLMAFAAIGIASMVWIQILFLVPIMMIVLATNILAMSLRTFVASILGLALPYWFCMAFYLYQGDISPLGEHFMQIAVFGKPFEIGNLSSADMATLIFVTILSAIGSVHFLRTSYMDKIRTRMIFEMFITMVIFTLLLIAIQPQHETMAIRLLIISTSPLIGHYFALTATKITNIATMALMATTLAITIYNLWT